MQNSFIALGVLLLSKRGHAWDHADRFDLATNAYVPGQVLIRVMGPMSRGGARDMSLYAKAYPRF